MEVYSVLIFSIKVGESVKMLVLVSTSLMTEVETGSLEVTNSSVTGSSDVSPWIFDDSVEIVIVSKDSDCKEVIRLFEVK